MTVESNPLSHVEMERVMGHWTTRLRAPVLIAAGLAGGISLPSNAADRAVGRASKPETTGVLSGFAVGAAAGGPIGAILGAAAGGWLGDRYHRKDVEQQVLATSLGESESRRERLGGEMQRVSAAAAEAEARSSRLAAAVDLTHELEATVHFRTDDAMLRDDEILELRRLGALLASLPDARARVSGFADPRGPKQHNQELSQQRAAAVAAELTAAGVDPGQLIVEAHGDEFATSDKSDLDGNAFERRVTVRLERSANRVARVE
jgi:outer membrane protein OmpA-like peptidoglycan-associated protein